MKKSDRVSVRETMTIHLRAVKDVNRLVPGVFTSTVFYAIVSALSPYATIWLSAQLIIELASTRRTDMLMRWVLLIIAVTALLGLVKSALERWHEARESAFYRQYDQLFSEKFLTMDFADADKQKTRDLFTQIQQSSNWGGWGFNYLDMYVAWLTQALSGLLGAIALTVSLFTQPVPEMAGALTVLNHPLFILGLTILLLGVTLLRPFITNKANAGWGALAEESRFGNRVFSHFQFDF